LFSYRLSPDTFGNPLLVVGSCPGPWLRSSPRLSGPWPGAVPLSYPGFSIIRRDTIYLSATKTRPALGPTLARIKWVKRPECRTDSSSSFSTSAKNAWSYSVYASSWRGA